MYPKQHLLVSFVTFTTYALASGMDLATAAVWIAVGTVVGVLIDVDHLLLSIFVDGKIKENLEWFRQPVRIFHHPHEYLEQLKYDGMRFHRLVSHTVIAAAVYPLLPFHFVFIPAFVSIVLHIITDIVGDIFMTFPHQE